jgi:hypothetical protein
MIYKGSTVIDRIRLGEIEIAKVYAGSTLVFAGPEVHTLASGVNTDIATVLSAAVADTARAQILTLPEGEIIGSNDANPALTLGDLSTYTKGVTLNINGEVQGAPGGPAIEVTDAVTWNVSGEVNGTVTSTAVSGGKDTINVYGAVRGGGGNGGVGGTGGAGDDAGTWFGPFYNSPDVYVRYNGGGKGITWWWAGGDVGPSLGLYKTTGGKIYAMGDFVTNGEYKISRASHNAGIGGSGGAGGQGVGYTVARTDGVNGGGGTNRSGNGGKGGNGGDWGTAGSNGSSGGNGLYYSAWSASEVRSGSGGSAGTAAGEAII